MEKSNVHPSELLEFVSILPEMKGSPLETPAAATGSDSPSKGDLHRGFLNDGHNLPSISSNALAASQNEHRMTFLHALQMYPKAIGWSAMLSLAIIMEGYDTALVNSLYAFQEFQQNYGVPTGNGQYQITSKWQASLSNGATVGAIIGLFINGILTEKLGYRYTMMGALAVLAVFIFPFFFAFNISTLLAAQILCGLPWGVFSTLTTAYAAEVMPLNLRVYLTSNVNLCWLLGQIIAFGVLRGFIDMNSSWSYRIPFGLQWVWIIIVFTGTVFAPESPWWLIRKNRNEEAKRVLLRLRRSKPGSSAADTVAMMIHTNEVEKHLNSRSGSNDMSYIECFRGSNLRRTEIACMIFISQNLCGLPIIGYAAYFYKQIGFGERRSFDLTVGMQGLAILGAFLSLILMKNFGRRTLYLWGLSLSFVILVIAGIIGALPETPATLWAIAALIMTFIFVFDATVGPLTYCLVAEIPSTRLRVKTVVLARVAYNVSGIITNILIQRMLNPLAWNWRGKSCFFCAITCLACLVYCYFRLPETSGLSFHELDILFEKKASARKFARFQKILEMNGYFSFYENDGNGSAGGSGDDIDAGSGFK